MTSITPTTAGGAQANLENWRKQGISDDTIALQLGQSNPTLAAHVDKVRQASHGDPRAVTSYLNWRFYGDPNYSPSVAPEEKGILSAPKRYLDNLYTNVQQGILNMEATKDKAARGQQGFLNTAAQTIGNDLSIIGSPATSLFQTAFETKAPLVNASINDAVGAGVNAFGQTKLGRQVLPAVSDAVQQYQQASENSPTLQSVNALAKGALDVAQIPAAGKVFEPAFNAAKAATNVAMHPVAATKQAASAVAGTVLHPVDSFQNLRASFSAPGTAQSPVSALSEAGKRAGIDERVTNLLHDASPEDRTLMQKTLQSYQDASKDFSAPNPKEIPGETILMRYRHLQPIKSEVGQRIGNIVNGAADENVNLSGTYEKFMNILQDKGVYVNADGRLVTDIGSVPKADLPFYQEIFNRLHPDEGAIETFKDAHLTRQWLFNEQNLAKARVAGYSDDAQAIADQVHSGILQEMSSTHPEYGILAKPYAQMTQTMNAFAQKMGKASAEELTSRSLRAGEVANRLLGNASADTKDIIDNLDEVARQFGFTSNTNIERQVRFADVLSRYFPTYSTTSLEGGVEKGVGKALGTLAKLKTGNIVGATGDAIQYLMGQSPEKQLKIIEKMLSMNADELAAAQTPEQIQALVNQIISSDGSPVAGMPEPQVPSGSAPSNGLLRKAEKALSNTMPQKANILNSSHPGFAAIPGGVDPTIAEAAKALNTTPDALLALTKQAGNDPAIIGQALQTKFGASYAPAIEQLMETNLGAANLPEFLRIAIFGK